MTGKELEKLWELYPEVRELYEQYNDILVEDDQAWKELTGRVRIPAFQCCLVSLPEKHGDSGYGYRKYPTPEKLQENQQRKIYPDESEGLLRIQAQDRRCTV